MTEVIEGRVEGVYRDHHARLWRSLLSYVGDASIASDAESEAFAQALRRADQIDDVAAWVWRAAFKIAAGMLKTQRRRWPITAVDDADIPPSLVEFFSMLDGLSEQQRRCIVMRYVGGHTPAEIAELLDTSPGTVRVQLHRAHTVLRRQLGSEGGRR